MLDNIIIDIINQFGYFGISFLITLENIFPPIPSEIVLVFGGVITNFTKLQPVWVIVFSTLGSLLGAIALYFLGYYFSIEKWYVFCDSKFGKILHIKKKDIKKSYDWFTKHGFKTVFWCRLLPVLRSVISIPAGMSKIDFKKFLFFTTLGSLIWNTFLVYLGVFSSNHWESMVAIFKSTSKIILVIVVLITIIIYKLKKNKKKSKA